MSTHPNQARKDLPNALQFDQIIAVPEGGLAAEHSDRLPDGMADRVDCILIPEWVLQDRVAGLAQQIHDNYADCQELVLLVVLKGAFVFAADLGRAISRIGGLEFRYEFIRTSAYGHSIKQQDEEAREVSVARLPDDLAGKDVLLVEDLIDQGFTLNTLKRRVLDAGVRSVNVCVLLEKRLAQPSPAVARNRSEMELDYVGFDVPDRWVAGYGTDAGEDFRMLPYIVTVREQHYVGREK
jgi:hypoxanthine phosphoribosyltransferase